MPNRRGVWSLSTQYQAIGDQNWIMAPAAPTGVSATAGNAEATVSFTAPTFTGIPAGITGYRATSNPGGLTGTGSSSPVTVTGLTNGTSYTFTVQATNSVDYGPEGGPSGSVSPYAPRALFGGGNTGSQSNVIDQVVMSTSGNASDFGDLSSARSSGYACSSTTRGIFAGGQLPSPSINTIEYVTIAATGSVTDFGDMRNTNYAGAGLSNSTRGIFAGGSAQSTGIDYITIASTGNASEFGSISAGAAENTGAFASSTRGVWGGKSGNSVDISYVTIASTGNSADFGDLNIGKDLAGGASSATRGLIGGSYGGSEPKAIDYVTIASTGNASDFGDLDICEYGNRGTSSSTKGLFMGGINSSAGFAKVNRIDNVTIASTGNATDFGDMTITAYNRSALSNDHGGLQ